MSVPERACYQCGRQADEQRGWWLADDPPYCGWFCNACLDDGIGLRFDVYSQRVVPAWYGGRPTLDHYERRQQFVVEPFLYEFKCEPRKRPRVGLMRFGVRA